MLDDTHQTTWQPSLEFLETSSTHKVQHNPSEGKNHIILETEEQHKQLEPGLVVTDEQTVGQDVFIRVLGMLSNPVFFQKIWTWVGHALLVTILERMTRIMCCFIICQEAVLQHECLNDQVPQAQVG